MTRAYNTATTQQNSGGAVPPVSAGKNLVINGGMDIWQRGTSFSSGGGLSVYAADRWHFYRGLNDSGATLSRQTSGLTGFQYATRLQRNSGNTSIQSIGLRHTLESADSYRLAGKTVTLSYYLRKGADYSGGFFRASIASGTGTDQPVYAFTNFAYAADVSVTPTTSWVRYSITGTIPSNATEVGLEMFAPAAGTAGTNDYVEVTGFQLEIGSVATDFSRAGGTIQGELAACQRYYFRTTGGGAFQPLCFGFATSSTNVMGYLQYPVTMRATPTVIEFSLISCNDSTVGSPVSAVAVSGTESGPQASTLNFTTSSMTTFRPTKILQYSNSAGYLALGAEL